MTYTDFIAIDSNARFGKPCIINTRITVYDVLNWLASGMSYEKIIENFPELNIEAILACLAYAANKEQGAAPRDRTRSPVAGSGREGNGGGGTSGWKNTSKIWGRTWNSTRLKASIVPCGIFSRSLE